MKQPKHTEPAAPALSPEAENYLTYLATQRRVSDYTQTGYRHELTVLFELAGEQNIHTLTTSDFNRFIAKLHGRGLGARSIARALSAWRGFYRWMVRFELIKANPLLAVRPPKAEKKLPKTLSVDQTNAMLEAEPDDELEMRDLAMFELFYSSGLRLAELAGLDTSGMYCVADGEVTVLGKRNKTRRVPVGKKALAALAQWLPVRALLAKPDEPALFVSQRGTRLTAPAIRQRLARWALVKGTPVHVHPHMLRHSFGSHMLQSSSDLRAVQELMGHASIRTTQIYTHLDYQHLAKIYDAAHPRAHRTQSEKPEEDE